MDSEQIPQAVVAGFARLLQGIVGLLFSFRTFCQVVAAVANLVGGWLRPILYRDAGERALRGSMTWLVISLIGWALFCEATRSMYEGINAGFARTDRVYLLAALWSVGLAAADWRAALHRRKSKTYTFSRFIGWPRLLPVSVASYPLPPIIAFVTGLSLWTWQLDRAGGVMLMVSAAAVLAQLWTITALRREDAFDLLDANWLSNDRSHASEELTSSGRGAADEVVARAVTTADMIRRFSI